MNEISFEELPDFCNNNFISESPYHQWNKKIAGGGFYGGYFCLVYSKYPKIYFFDRIISYLRNNGFYEDKQKINFISDIYTHNYTGSNHILVISKNAHAFFRVEYDETWDVEKMIFFVEKLNAIARNENVAIFLHSTLALGCCDEYFDHRIEAYRTEMKLYDKNLSFLDHWEIDVN